MSQRRGLGIVRPILLALCAALLGGSQQASAQTKPLTPEQLGQLSLEELMNLEVTSVSKQPQRISQAPAAVTVITQEDISRSGMTTIPDLLRLAPGMEVARVNGSPWAISSRGLYDILDGRAA